MTTLKKKLIHKEVFTLLTLFLAVFDIGLDYSLELHTRMTQQEKVNLVKDLLDLFIDEKTMLRSVVSFWLVDAIFKYVHNELV